MVAVFWEGVLVGLSPRLSALYFSDSSARKRLVKLIGFEDRS